jgi:hypothetical protein
MGEGPLEKYQTVGRIDSTSWRTGQPSLDVNVIACTHIQVVYSGVNITSPSTCAQANFSYSGKLLRQHFCEGVFPIGW